MKSAIIKRSVSFHDRKTSISLEDVFWLGLKEIAFERQLPVSAVIEEISASKPGQNVSSAIRLFVLDHYKHLCTKSA